MPASDVPLPASLTQGADDITERQLLQSVVEVARLVFGAAASSVFLVDAETGELVFEAVAGEGQSGLPGVRFPPGTGIAGWVASCGQPMIVDDLDGDTAFDRSAAESTGYVPESVMAAPLVRGGECLGVLEVLDRRRDVRDELADIELLGMLATEAAIALELLLRLRGSNSGIISLAQHMVRNLPGRADAMTEAVTRLLVAADELRSGARAGQGEGGAV